MKQHSRQIEPEVLQDLQQLARRQCSTPVLWRARIVLAFFEAAGYRQISPRFRCSQASIARWVKRVRAQGVALFLPQTVHHSPRAVGWPRNGGPCRPSKRCVHVRPASAPASRVSPGR